MGLCPSRNAKATKDKFVGGETYQPAQKPFQSSLRSDAAAFVPTDKVAEQEVPKKAWELFLEQKATQDKKPFRRTDGTFTGEYRKLLEANPRRAGPSRAPPGLEKPATGAINEDVMRSWQEVLRQRPVVKPAEKKRPVDPLREAMRKVQPPKEQVLAELAEQETKVAQDDLACVQRGARHVPFGLSDRHYVSGEEDAGSAQVHRSLKASPCREYVPKAITPALEQGLTEVLYQLRQLKNSEQDQDNRRYCVGLREVMRASKEPGVLKAVVVAPDLEKAGKGLDEKLQSLLAQCRRAKTPVVFGLSRRRLGQAIQKSVSISVLGILDTRGVQAPFDHMLALSQ